MQDFPQELVDRIIDNLNELLKQPAPEAWSQTKLSDYSTVSKRWVNRTQYHHFGSLHFMNYYHMDRWRETIRPDPSGVSRHVRALHWHYIGLLRGFEDHLRALTNIEEATFDRCYIFDSPNDVQLLSQVGSNLVGLTINGATMTPAALTSFLAALPHLRQFRTSDLLIRLNGIPAVSQDNIPFFKGANNLTLLLEDHLPGRLTWFPSTVRFTNLGVGIPCIRHDWDLVNGWIASSRETLERFDIHWESESDNRALTPLDLSKCTYLKTLQLPILCEKPELFADAIASITSLRLSTIILRVERVGDVFVDPQRWKIMEECLCRLAKQFRASQGEKMLVEIYLYHPGTATLLPQFRDGGLMPNLGEEAKIVVNVEERAEKNSDFSVGWCGTQDQDYYYF